MVYSHSNMESCFYNIVLLVLIARQNPAFCQRLFDESLISSTTKLLNSEKNNFRFRAIFIKFKIRKNNSKDSCQSPAGLEWLAALGTRVLLPGYSSPEPSVRLCLLGLGRRKIWPPFPRAKSTPVQRDRRLWALEWRWKGKMHLSPRKLVLLIRVNHCLLRSHS